ncbi:MAG TPA: hypothetical protein VFF73_35330 [Planctomycetota bacterium]|nr:hypothetical protein [Planctomycetota bacterium]
MDPVTVRQRFMPTVEKARLLLDAVSEVEAVDEDALPAATIAAPALAALRERSPRFLAERVVLSVPSVACAGELAQVSGSIRPAGDGHVVARATVHQGANHVLEVEMGGAWRPPHPDPRPAARGEGCSALSLYARATSTPVRGLTSWPVDYLVALCAAGAEAENEDGLARLLRLALDVVQEAPLDAPVRFAVDGIRPVSGDTARVVFRVTADTGRLVARGDALIVSALARSAAMAIPLRMAA